MENVCHFHRMLCFSIFNKEHCLGDKEKVLAFMKGESHINVNGRVICPDRIIHFLVEAQVAGLLPDTTIRMTLP